MQMHTGIIEHGVVIEITSTLTVGQCHFQLHDIIAGGDSNGNCIVC